MPSKVISFNDATSTIARHWEELQAVFGQSDQCLSIEDPLESVMRELAEYSVSRSANRDYVLRRLPLGTSWDADEADQKARALLGRSLTAMRARARGDDLWLETSLAGAIEARRASREVGAVIDGAERLAATTGVSVDVLRALRESLRQCHGRVLTMAEWFDWMIVWLSANPQYIPALLRPSTLERFFGKKYKDLPDPAAKGRYANARLYGLLALWMRGSALSELEREGGTPEAKLGGCINARKFALQLVPELAYAFTLPGLIARSDETAGLPTATLSAGLLRLGVAVEEGVDRIELLALQELSRARVSRRELHREFERVVPYLRTADVSEEWEQTLRRVDRARRLATRRSR